MVILQHPENKSTIFKALSHPLRRDIIIILAENGSMGFTELQSTLSKKNNKKIQVGGIYHHMGLLEHLVNQDSQDRSWSLNSLGEYAYDMMDSVIPTKSKVQPKDSKIVTGIFTIFAPKKLFEFVIKTKFLFLGWEIVFFVIFAYFCSQTKLTLVAFFFNDSNFDSDILLSFLSILISLFAFSLVVIIIINIMVQKSLSLDDILIIILFNGLAILPLSIFPLMIFLNIFTVSDNISLSIAVILQLWTIIIVARGISIQFKTSLEKGALISLISIYVMILFGLFLS